jgi:hypothetical protein
MDIIMKSLNRWPNEFEVVDLCLLTIANFAGDSEMLRCKILANDGLNLLATALNHVGHYGIAVYVNIAFALKNLVILKADTFNSEQIIEHGHHLAL